MNSMNEQERKWRLQDLQDRKVFQGCLDGVEKGYYDTQTPEERTKLIRRTIDYIFAISRRLGDLPNLPGRAGDPTG